MASLVILKNISFIILSSEGKDIIPLRFYRLTASVTGQQLLILLNTTGALLVEETPLKRMEITKQVWDSFDQFGEITASCKSDAFVERG